MALIQPQSTWLRSLNSHSMNNQVTISQLGTILGIWAHPDDETFMVGGLLHEAAKVGQRVICVTATKGEAGVQDELRWPAAALGDIRAQELAAALEILGTSEHHWLGYQDGKCAGVDEAEAMSQISALIQEYQPDTVITFASDGLTGHEDHQAVSRWATAAVNQCSQPPALYYAVHTQEIYDTVFCALDERLNIYFNTAVPVFIPADECNLVLKLSQETLDTKIRALQAMPSQYEALFSQCSDVQVSQAFGSEALVAAK